MNEFSCQNLSFYYGKKVIFENINFKFQKGDIIALVGQNGVGKTTFLKILSQKFLKDDVSILYDKPSLYPYLTGMQNLIYYANIYNISQNKLKEILDLMKIGKEKDIKISKCSLGMKQKLAICKCLLKPADIYLFDEPINGLDPLGVINFRHVIKYLKDQNKTVIISSHILKEITTLANKVFYVKNHKIGQLNLNKTKEFLINVSFIPSLCQKYYYKDNFIKVNLSSLNDVLCNLVINNALIYDISYFNEVENLFEEDNK